MSHPVAVKARFLRLLSALSCLTLLSMLGAIPAHAGSPTPLLAPVLEAAKNLKLADEHLAVTAIPLNGPGDARFLNADTPFNPGSIMKVVTTYAALELLGPTYQWHTRLYTDGKISGNSLQGNLYFAGSGDPKLTEERLWLLMRELRAMGIDHIQGDLVLDASAFNLPNGIPLMMTATTPMRPSWLNPTPCLPT